MDLVIDNDDDLKNKIKEWFSLEKKIHDNNKILQQNNLNKLLKIYYNTNVSFYKNYFHYQNISQQFKYHILSDNFSHDIKSLHHFYMNRHLIKYNNRLLKKKITLTRNSIITYMKNTNKINHSHFNILQISKNKHFIGLNKYESAVYNILNKLYNKYSQIILIIPQFKLPIKLKKPLTSDFMILLNIHNQLFQIILEIDGPQHYDTNYYLFNISVPKADLIKNNFCILNQISCLRISYYEKNIYHIIELFIKNIITNKKNIYRIRDYSHYYNMINI